MAVGIGGCGDGKRSIGMVEIYRNVRDARTSTLIQTVCILIIPDKSAQDDSLS